MVFNYSDKHYDFQPTCSVTNSNHALANIWLPYKEVMAIKRNTPSRTGVGISVRGVGNISRDDAIRVLERKPVNLVSLTLTMLQKRKCIVCPSGPSCPKVGQINNVIQQKVYCQYKTRWFISWLNIGSASRKKRGLCRGRGGGTYLERVFIQGFMVL